MNKKYIYLVLVVHKKTQKQHNIQKEILRKRDFVNTYYIHINQRVYFINFSTLEYLLYFYLFAQN